MSESSYEADIEASGSDEAEDTGTLDPYRDRRRNRA